MHNEYREDTQLLTPAPLSSNSPLLNLSRPHAPRAAPTVCTPRPSVKKTSFASRRTRLLVEMLGQRQPATGRCQSLPWGKYLLLNAEETLSLPLAAWCTAACARPVGCTVFDSAHPAQQPNKRKYTRTRCCFTGPVRFTVISSNVHQRLLLLPNRPAVLSQPSSKCLGIIRMQMPLEALCSCQHFNYCSSRASSRGDG